MANTKRHVVSNPQGGWSVRVSGAARATRVFPTQEQAEKYAEARSEQDHGEVYVHRRDGTVVSRRSYQKNAVASKR